MARPLSQLAANWDVVVTTWLMPLTGNGPTVEPNSSRLAIGFSYARNNLVSVIPVATGTEPFAFHFQGPGDRWFWFHRYASLVGLAWRFDNGVGGIDSVKTIELIETEHQV